MFSINAGISPNNYASYLPFVFSGQQSAHLDTMFKENGLYIAKRGTNITGRVPCFPFYSMLKAINTTYIDLLSLDVQGTEEFILKTIPYDKLFIGVIYVEFDNYPNKKKSLKRLENYKLFFNRTGLFNFIGNDKGNAIFQNIHYNP